MLWWSWTVNKYPHITERAHMMHMFKLAFSQHITDLSNERTRGAIEESVDDAGSLCTDADAQSEMDRCVAEAPPLVKRVLETVIKDPQVLAAPFRHYIGGRIETLGDRLCLIIGIEPDPELVKSVYAYLRER